MIPLVSLRARASRLEQRRGSTVAVVHVPFGLLPAERAAIVAAFVPPAGVKYLLEVHGTAPSGAVWETFCSAEAAEVERRRAAAAEAAAVVATTPDDAPTLH